MKGKPIIIIAGEPYSVFFEIFFKTLKSKSIKKISKPIILIACKKLLLNQMKALNFKFYVEELNIANLNISINKT